MSDSSWHKGLRESLDSLWPYLGVIGAVLLAAGSGHMPVELPRDWQPYVGLCVPAGILLLGFAVVGLAQHFIGHFRAWRQERQRANATVQVEEPQAAPNPLDSLLPVELAILRAIAAERTKLLNPNEHAVRVLWERGLIEPTAGDQIAQIRSTLGEGTVFRLSSIALEALRESARSRMGSS